MFNRNGNDNVEQELRKLRRVAAVAKRYQNAVMQKRSVQAISSAPRRVLQDVELEIGSAEFDLMDAMQDWENPSW